MHSKTSFTEIKSYAESILREIKADYQLKPSDYRTFIPGRGAEVIVNGRTAGYFGEVSPQVILDFEINHPVVMFELDLTDFISASKGGLF